MKTLIFCLLAFISVAQQDTLVDIIDQKGKIIKTVKPEKVNKTLDGVNLDKVRLDYWINGKVVKSCVRVRVWARKNQIDKVV